MKKIKVVLITGANTGLGFAIASYLAKKRYRVYAGYRKHRNSNLKNLNSAIQKNNGFLSKIELDVTDEKTILKAIDKIIKENGKIDVVINNAAISLIGTIETCFLEQQKKIMDVNYFGVVRVLQSVLPYMRDQKEGRIINISSTLGFFPYPVLETYASTKAALESLTESLAIYLSKWNIFCSLVEPGAIKTRIIFKSFKGNRMKKETKCFFPYIKNKLKIMKNGFKKSQDPKEIAKIIEKIIKVKNPHFRYQTDSFSRKKAKEYFLDITGDKRLKREIFNLC